MCGVDDFGVESDASHEDEGVILPTAEVDSAGPASSDHAGDGAAIRGDAEVTRKNIFGSDGELGQDGLGVAGDEVLEGSISTSSDNAAEAGTAGGILEPAVEVVSGGKHAWCEAKFAEFTDEGEELLVLAGSPGMGVALDDDQVALSPNFARFLHRFPQV